MHSLPPAAANLVSRRRPPRRRPRAFALVVVLIILSLLAVVSVSFLASMSNERVTANALTGKMRAEQAAQAGVDSAMATLRESFRAFPDSATVWDDKQSQNDDTAHPYNEGASLYVRAVPSANDANSPNAALDADNRPPHDPADPTAADKRQVFVLPLVSGASFQLQDKKANAINNGAPLSLTDDKSVDLNARRKQGDTQGLIGTPPFYPDTTAPKPVRVPWVEIKQQGYADESKAPLIARYAYWVEDESFRANVNYAQLGEGNGHTRADNTNIPAGGLGPANVDMLGVFQALAEAVAPKPTSLEADAQSIFDTRAFFPAKLFPEPRAFAHTTNLTFPRYADIYGSATLTPEQKDQKALARYVDQISYYTTTNSAALNLSRHGSQRLNLNAVVDNKAVNPDKTTQVESIVKTIGFHAPSFGQRFYRFPTSNPADANTPVELNKISVKGDTFNADHSKIYLYKVAANIVDYIDADSVPTMVGDDGKVRGEGKPTIPFGDSGSVNSMWAQGKDAAPFLTETAARYTGVIDTQGDGRHYTLNTDYYVEVWNMSNQDIKPGGLGPNAFIRIGNSPKWVGNNSTALTGPTVAAYASNALLLVSDDPDRVTPNDTRNAKPGRDFDIDISNVTFLAGGVVVITTDPNYSEIIKDEAAKHVVQCNFKAPGKRTYKGKVPDRCDVINLYFNTTDPAFPSASSSSDYDTDVLIGSDSGYIDCLNGALPISASGGRIIINSSSATPGFKIYGGYMRGNWTNTSSAPTEGKQASALGDPRSLNEQLVYTDPNYTGSAADRSRFNVSDTTTVASPTVTNPATGIIPTLGLPNYRSVRPNRPENPWPDFPPIYEDPTKPKDTEVAMTPAMTAAKAPAVIANAQLRSIGQLGDVYDPARFAASATNINGSRGGGRSFKIGQHDDRWDGNSDSPSRGWASWRLADMFCISDSMTQYGLININGVIRDNGAALKAALTGFKFQPAPQGDGQLDDSSASASRLKVQNLVDQILYRINSPLTVNGQPNTGYRQTGAGPFWERGEISELPGFGRTPTPTASSATFYSTTKPDDPPPAGLPLDLTGLDMSKGINDRGREELVRRLIDMTTTRGDVFTVHALGQSILQSNPNDIKTRRITGTHQVKVTFQLVPKNKSANLTATATDFHPGADDNGNPLPFNPANTSQVAARFDKPDHYDIKILSVSSGGG